MTAQDAVDKVESKVSHKSATEKWQQFVWFTAVVFLFVTMCFLLWTVWNNSARSMDVIVKSSSQGPLFIFAGLSLVNSSLIKTLAILAGTAISFAGMAISFFSHEKANQLVASNKDTTGGQAKIALTAYSPGIFGVVVGAAIIMTAVLTPNRHTYTPAGTTKTTYTTPATADDTKTATPFGLPPPDAVEKTDINANSEVGNE
jgi:hypothetical protein